jgi:protein-L-isoaspartate(D-aspartate) O-methyltransferase
MTGAAEAKRVVKPDPLKPALTNGSFEEVMGDDNEPVGWHYVRQAKVEMNQPIAPAGKQFITFKNEEPGRGCQALQGFAIDGRKVKELHVSFQARGKDIRYGQRRDQWPFVVVTFYDDKRRQLDHQTIGPMFGTFDWTEKTGTMAVPVHAREAIIRIGLLGAIGELSIDDLRLWPGS